MCEFRFIDLFAGLGGIRLPFDELGGRCVFSSECDEAARRSYEANFGELPAGDITQVPADDVPAHDLLLAGFPCQAFSIMGKRQGFADTRGTMFFEVERLLRHHRPRAVLLENVKQLVTHDGGRTFAVIRERLASLGYHLQWRVLNALHFGVPQRRERVIVVGLRDAALAARMSLDFQPMPYSLRDVLEPDADLPDSVWASQAIRDKRAAAVDGRTITEPAVWHENKSGHVSVLPYSCALRTGASYNYLLVNGRRRFTCRELLRLQGFPDTYKIAVGPGELRRQTGNSVAVPMIRAVARRLVPLISENLTARACASD